MRDSLARSAPGPWPRPAFAPRSLCPTATAGAYRSESPSSLLHGLSSEIVPLLIPGDKTEGIPAPYHRPKRAASTVTQPGPLHSGEIRQLMWEKAVQSPSDAGAQRSWCSPSNPGCSSPAVRMEEHLASHKILNLSLLSAVSEGVHPSPKEEQPLKNRFPHQCTEERRKSTEKTCILGQNVPCNFLKLTEMLSIETKGTAVSSCLLAKQAIWKTKSLSKHGQTGTRNGQTGKGNF